MIRKAIEKMGYTVTKINTRYEHQGLMESTPDIKSEEFWEIYNQCKPYTMTSVERMYALYQSVDYILKNNIQGDFIECGVWRGGSSMLIALMLSKRGFSDRAIYLYDTFEGMSEPTTDDVDLLNRDAAALLEDSKHIKENSIWCLTDLSEVRENMKLTNYPESRIKFIKGKVEDTIPQILPDASIALLRLDTDWYESTKHELIHLYPLISKNGVLIIDDYGHWEGCRKAVDEYFSENKITMLLNRIDYTGRMGIKTEMENDFL